MDEIYSAISASHRFFPLRHKHFTHSGASNYFATAHVSRNGRIHSESIIACGMTPYSLFGVYREIWRNTIPAYSELEPDHMVS
jgi:hypothetical protein